MDMVRTASVDFSISSTTDTASEITVASEAINYNVDSFIINDLSVTAYDLSNVTKGKIAAAFISLKNADSINNVDNIASCTLKLHSDLNTTPVNLTTSNTGSYPNAQIIFSAVLTDGLKPYLINNTGKVKTLYYTLAVKLRKPTTIKLHGTLQLTFDLHLDKETKTWTKFSGHLK